MLCIAIGFYKHKNNKNFNYLLSVHTQESSFYNKAVTEGTLICSFIFLGPRTNSNLDPKVIRQI